MHGGHVGSRERALTPDQLRELETWARHLVASGAAGDLGSFARTIVPLAGEAARRHDDVTLAAGAPAPTIVELEPVRRRAEVVLANGAPDELRAAARAVLLLCSELAPPAEPPAVVQRRHRRLLALGLAAVVAAGVLLVVLLPRGSSSLGASGLESAVVGEEALSHLAFSVRADSAEAAATRWRVDGRDVRGRTALAGGRVVFRPGLLRDGVHTVDVSRGGGLFASSSTASWTFTVDTTPPAVRVAKGSLEARRGARYTLRGAVEPGSTVTVDGRPVPLDLGGAFTVSRERAPTRTIVIRARDAAGNLTDARITVQPAPRRPARPVRAVHVSQDAWADDALRAGILALLGEHRINAVELDLKDELGIVGWNAGVPLARRIGATRNLFDLRGAVNMLHERGARVIGRLVAFRDPVLARWAWRSGRRELVVQTPDGEAYSGGYGGFTNFAAPIVQNYNVDIAEAAAKLGVDEVLYDYVRRPDGPPESMIMSGLEGDPARAIVAFLARSRKRLSPHGTFLGASVFGIAATRPAEIAQDVSAIAREVDYVAPMLYPSHWGRDEYGLTNPDAQPYAIVRRSLRDFRKAVRGSGARLVPWLQDFSLQSDYGRSEVRAQIDAARDAGIDEFLLWDPRVTYTASALRRDARVPATGTLTTAPGAARLVPIKPSRRPDDPVPSGLRPNELGVVPVIMYHQFLPAGMGDYVITPDQFRAELDRLYRAHYRPVRASDLVNGTIDLPRGATPVVLTFDDSTKSQAGLLDNGRIDPATAVGVMLAFAREHPDWRPAGTFYVNRAPFAGEPRAAELAQRVVSLGFEFGNHTRAHIRLDELDDNGVQRQIVEGNRLIAELLPGATVATIALPYGIQPDRPGLALAGSWDGDSYRFGAAFLAGAEPAPSPFSTRFDPLAVPRIRTVPGSLENGSSDWLRRLAASPELRYVSDGNRRRIMFPESASGDLAARFRARARPYR